MASIDSQALPPIISARDMACGYLGQPVVAGITLDLLPGDMVAVLGRNGSGKSTLLRCLSGVLSPLQGTITLQGTPIQNIPRREVARVLAVTPQEVSVPFAFSVREVVELGRAPYAGFLHLPTQVDQQAVAEALRVTNLSTLAEKPFQQLSGGEQQRVALALALAQQPQALLLDEPTVHLDIAHQVTLLALLRRLCRERGLAVLAAMHDINLTCLYFDRIVMLGGGTVLAAGQPGDVITADTIRRAFDTRVIVGKHPCSDVPQVSLLP